MQTLKSRGRFNLAVIGKTFIRTVAVTNDSEATRKFKSWREIPGPPSLPFLGPLFSFLPGGVFHGYKGVQLSEQMYKKFGPIVRLNGVFSSPDIVILFDANAVEHVLRSENTMPIRPGFPTLDYYRKQYNKTYDPHRQTGLISDHGENWKDFRSKVNHILLQPKTIKLYTDVLTEVANDMITRMRSIRDENNMIKKKFDVEMNLWALESIGVVALGKRLDCFDPNLPEDSAARKLIQNVHDFFAITDKVDFGISPWRYFSTPNFKRAMRIYDEHAFLTKFFIDEAIKNMEDSKRNSSSTSDTEKPILEKLLEIDVQVALIMASDMLMAGVDTVVKKVDLPNYQFMAILLVLFYWMSVWVDLYYDYIKSANTALATFYLLAKNPEKQNILREQVLAKQGRNPYLRACIKESMRMLPVVNGNVRLSTKEYNLLGYKIPKDMTIIFSHQYMAIMEEHYTKPNEFLPERWVAGKDDPLYHGNAHPFANSPFGFGVRMCIGRRIAELEMETFISKVVENFEIGWEGPPPGITATSLNYITEPFNFTFKDLSA